MQGLLTKQASKHLIKPAHQGLHHEVALLPHVRQEAVHVDVLHLHHPLQHAVQDDEGARAPHPRAAVHHHGGAVLVVVLADALDEGDERGGKLWHAVVGPAQEQEVSDYQRRAGYLQVEFRL